MELVDMIGVNTHLDFAYKGSHYLDTKKTLECLKYLKVRHIRDGAGKPESCKLWVDFRNELGGVRAQFCAYLPNGGPDFVTRTFSFWPQLYRNGLINLFEAPNEPDKPYSLALGNSIAWTAEFTRETLSPYANAMGKKLVNLSVGSGWTAEDGWQGNYDAIPDMTGFCDFANPHTYPNVGQDVVTSIKRLNMLAQKSMPGKPIMITELGWNHAEGHGHGQIATDIIRAVQSGLAERIYIYALFDDQSGQFGLFNGDGSPRPAAKAIRQLLGGII